MGRGALKITALTTLGLAATLTTCAHYSDVVPGKDGINQVAAAPDEDDEDPDEDELSRDAMNQATDYCEELFKQKPKILSAKKVPIQGTDR